ncbi:MAG: TRZ/ATZ family protein [Oscillospiraceae bacterium]|jgi:fumarate hydratase subunit beta|nr:TRZ/ATZ family protein [Oscillospiraceae bacterium]
MKITLPFTLEMRESVKIGDVLELTGNIYTARDAAHQRIREAVEQGLPLPIDLQNAVIFYCGPCPASPGRVIGPLGPTTSARMDPYVEMMFQHGMAACIGKGDRAPYVAELCKQYKGLYLLGVGGAAVLCANAVKEVEELAYPDLGTESIKRYYVEDFKVVVGIDAQGRTIQGENIRRYRRR